MELGAPAPFREGMPCPVDGEFLAAAMRIYDIEGMEIDLCPTCALVWMDAGEWPKLGSYLENAGRERASVGPAGPPAVGDRKLPVPMDAGDLFGLFFDALWDRVFRKW